MQAAAEVGITSETKRYPTTITQSELLEIIDQLNLDERVDGILVQLPVPDHMNERVICDAVCCNKDVDGFNEKNVGRLCLDINTLIPCTALGVQELIKRSNIETFGKNCVVVGRSKNVGLPIFMLLHADGRNDTGAMDATVTMCHRFTPTEQLRQYCQNADIIISATGVPNLIKADMVKPGACIIDVGITRVKDEATGRFKLVGDADYDGKCPHQLCSTAAKLINCFLSLDPHRSSKGRRTHNTRSRRCWPNDRHHAHAKHLHCLPESSSIARTAERQRTHFDLICSSETIIFFR